MKAQLMEAIAIPINQNWPSITTAKYSKFGFKFMKTIGCGKSPDLEATFLKLKNKKLLFNCFTRCRSISHS